jgi:hypothetical protein
LEEGNWARPWPENGPKRNIEEEEEEEEEEEDEEEEEEGGEEEEEEEEEDLRKNRKEICTINFLIKTVRNNYRHPEC